MLGSAQAAAPSAPAAVRDASPEPSTATATATAGTVATRLVLAAWCLLAVGASWSDGQYSAPGLAAIVAGLALVFWVVARGAPLGAPSRGQLGIAAAVAVVAALAHPVHRYMHVRGGSLLAIQVLAAVSAVVAAATLLVRRDRAAWAVGAAVAMVTGAVVVVLVPNPHIDVWYLLQQSSDGLARGDDMYRQHWVHSHGLQAVYPYLPMTTVLLAPFRWVFGDVRAGLLLAALVTSVQLRRLAPAAPALLALLVLVHPHWAFLVDQSWTEPLILALLTTAVVAIERERPVVAVVALAAALASKQHVVLLLPLFALWPRFGWRRTAVAALLAVAMVVPWIVAGPRDLWHDAVHANLALAVIPRALSVPSLLLRHGVTVGFWFPLVALAATYLVVVRRAPRTTAGLALSSALVLWVVDVTNKQSFFNHYTLPLGLLVVALGAASRHDEVPR